jgi:TonB family protein
MFILTPNHLLLLAILVSVSLRFGSLLRTSVVVKSRSRIRKESRMKTKLFAAGIVALVGAALSCPKTPVQSHPPGSQAQTRTPENGAQSYSHDARGLEQEYDGFLQAAAFGDTQERDRQFAVFMLPDMSAWFGQYFAKEQVEQLGWDYEAEGAAYERSLLNVLPLTQDRFYAHCKALSGAPPTSLQPRADAVQPSRLVPLEQFKVEFMVDGGGTFSEMANFVYVDGAFRYMGRGSYPFWSMPDSSEGEKSSPKEGAVTLPSCYYTPSPPVTDKAIAAKFEGQVSVQGVITTDGRVTNLRIVKWTGLDPSKSVYGLDESIMSTLKTWKCRPALRDGKPVAIQAPIEITFRRR